MPSTFNRRAILGCALALAIWLPGSAALAADYPVIEYTPAALAEARASGAPFVLDFFAPWCSTCRAQERVIAGLMQDNAAYRGIPIIRVDWDTNRTGPLVAELQIPRRSTLVVMQGNDELGRVVADTRQSAIAALLDLAL
jgi:thiol:disulfide interchange protein